MRDKSLETQLRLLTLQLDNWKKLHDLITYGLDKARPIISAEQERQFTEVRANLLQETEHVFGVLGVLGELSGRAMNVLQRGVSVRGVRELSCRAQGSQRFVEGAPGQRPVPMLEREHRQIVLVRCQAAQVPRPLPERLRTRVALLRLLHITALAAHDRHLADRIAGHDVVTDLLCQLECLHEIRFRAIHGIDVEECESDVVDRYHHAGRVVQRREPP